MVPDLFFPCAAKSLMPGELCPQSLSGADFSECLHTVFRLHGFGFLTEEQGTIGVVNVCRPLVAILLFQCLQRHPQPSPRGFRRLCLQQRSVRFYTGVNVLGGTSGTNVPPKTGDTSGIIHSFPRTTPF